jgi:hypothetical protein
MTKSQQKKLLSTNAGIWAVATLLSFVLPLVTDSLTAGRSGFLRAFVHAFLLIAGMFFANAAISRAIGPPSDQ